MKKIIIALVILIIIAIGAYYLFFNKAEAPQTEIQTSATGVPEIVIATNIKINIKNFSFNPTTLKIGAGTKVTWTNNDSTSHTVTSDSGNLLQSPVLSPGQSFSFTFTKPGIINYHCNIHPMMKAKVTVI